MQYGITRGSAMRWRILRAALVLTLTLPAGVGAATFTPLANPVGGYNFRLPVGISADGTTVVGSSGSGIAVRWVNSASPQSLGFMVGGSESYAVAASADGSVVVGRGNALLGPGSPYPGQVTVQGFRWTESDGMHGLGYLPGGWYYAIATDVSADGSVVVGYSDGPANTRAYRWTQSAGLEDIGHLPGPGGGGNSEAYGVSADGSVVVGSASGTVDGNFGTYAFRWDADSGMIALASLPGSNSSRALAAAADGSIVVGDSFIGSCGECDPPRLARNNAVRWIDQGPATLLGQVPGGDQGSVATAISADGSVIAGYYYEDSNNPISGFRAFLWTETEGMQKLLDVLLMQGATGLDGWTLLQASGVSADGRTIAGYGINPTGMYQAYVATVNAVPVPAAVWLFGGALGALGWLKRMKSYSHCCLRRGSPKLPHPGHS